MNRAHNIRSGDTRSHPEREAPCITVALCTYNRYEHLKSALDALSRQTLDPERFQVLIVDNSDDLAARREFEDEYACPPNARTIDSSPPGLSRARNVALESCTTPYIAYLDDDAQAEPGWLAAVLQAFSRHDAAAVAGPIDPIWPGPLPQWMPWKYAGCLAILDYGTEDRWLGENEFAYGANMSFRAEALREVGGFNTSLGRRGSASLLSEEELELQMAIANRGGRVFYAAQARVHHTVPHSRMTRNYFRARMAWQAVSALLRDPPLRHFDWSREQIASAARTLGVEEFLPKLLASEDEASFTAQIDLIYHLFALLLESKDVDDGCLENLLGAASIRTQRQITLPQAAGAYSDYAPRAPIQPGVKHLFVEGQPSHFFLCNLYADLEDAQLLEFPNPMWHSFDEPLAYVERSLAPSVETLTFVTIDALLYGPSRPALLRLLRTTRIKCFGVLHRPPENAEQMQALQEGVRSLSGLMVLAPAILDRLVLEFGVYNAAYLPLQASVGAQTASDSHTTRERIGAGPDDIVLSILGEARRGKGIDLLLSAIDHVPQEVRSRMFFLIAGMAKHMAAEAIAGLLTEKGVKYHVDLRSSDHPLRYDVLSEREFADYVSASDVGLMLYQYEQRSCMSGVAPNYVWSAKPVAAIAGTVIGQLVADHELGVVAADDSPRAVAQALTEAVQRLDAGWRPSTAFEAHRAEIAPEEVLARLGTILEQPPRIEENPAAVAGVGEDAETATRLLRYLSNLPLLHSWDGGKTWNTGGFDSSTLAKLYRFLKAELPAAPILLETGAGNSTICFLLLKPKRLISIAPDRELFARIRSSCAENEIDTGPLEEHTTCSEWLLPKLASENRVSPPYLDFALIDGSHAWPIVFVDFTYVNHMLKPGGLLMIDDVNLHSVKELARLLAEQPGFEQVFDLGKALLYRRTSDARSLGEWTELPYITRMTEHYARADDSFSLYPRVDGRDGGTSDADPIR